MLLKICQLQKINVTLNQKILLTLSEIIEGGNIIVSLSDRILRKISG